MSLPPAGWYPDPERHGAMRWFDGAGWQPVWAQPPARPTGMGPGAKAALIIGLVLGGIMLLGVVAAVAIPVFLNQRANALLAELDTVTCDQLAVDAVRIAADDAAAGAVELVNITGTTVVEDRRSSLRIPPQGQEALVLTCGGTGQWADGYRAEVLIDLTIDAERNRWVQTSWAP